MGKGCEAFVTSTQGKTLAYVSVLAAEDRILRTDRHATRTPCCPISRNTASSTTSRSRTSAQTTFEFHVAGPAAAEICRSAAGQLPEELDLAHVQTELAGRPVRLIRESPTPLPGFTLIGKAADARPVTESLLEHGHDLGLVEAGPEVFEILEIEAGTPVFGKDVTDKNLPQEIGRDARAISFVKGCYLGQETVARLDRAGPRQSGLAGARLRARLALPRARNASGRRRKAHQGLSPRRHFRPGGTRPWRWRSFGPATPRTAPRFMSGCLRAARRSLRP